MLVNYERLLWRGEEQIKSKTTFPPEENKRKTKKIVKETKSADAKNSSYERNF
jgi:hypothetical protein